VVVDDADGMAVLGNAKTRKEITEGHPRLFEKGVNVGGGITNEKRKKAVLEEAIGDKSVEWKGSSHFLGVF
jgi:hypothetical protein